MLDGKRIVVTGVASGIGAETAKILKAKGAFVIGLDRNDASASVDSFIQVDLTSKASVDDAVASITGNIDGLCNIAGLPPTADRKLVMAVNLVGLRYFTKSMIVRLNDGASIVNVASLAGFGWAQAIETINEATASLDFDNIEEFCIKHEISNERSYFFSKEWLRVWTMQNRWTWRGKGIRMNTVSPGPVDTPILKDFIETLGERAEEDMKVMDRPGNPRDIAPIIAFLCSDESAWVRGSDIAADGGMSSHIQQNIHGF